MLPSLHDVRARMRTALVQTLNTVKAKLATYDGLSMYNLVKKHPTIMLTWDIEGMIGLVGNAGAAVGPCASLRNNTQCNTCVTVYGREQDLWEVNYVLYGMLMNAALMSPLKMEQYVFARKAGGLIVGEEACKPTWQFTAQLRHWLYQGYSSFPKTGMLVPAENNTRFKCCRKCDSSIKLTKAFAYALFQGWGSEKGWARLPIHTD